MAFHMEMRCAPVQVESHASLERRARVICFRLSQGERVDVPAWDPVSAVLFDMMREGHRLPAGNAHGAIPEAL